MVAVSPSAVWPLSSDHSSSLLVEAVQRGDLRAVAECLADPATDVNYAGAVWLRLRRPEVVLGVEIADEVRVEVEELRTDASPLFLAAHAGNIVLVRFLLGKGADVNQKLFRGYALTAAVREGNVEAVDMLLKAGASQPACEEAVVEASMHGRPRLAAMLMNSDLVRPQVAVHALVTAAYRGFANVVDTLIKCGVDANATDRVLLRSLKPSLHTHVECTALIAAIISRQVTVVRHLLQAGVSSDRKVTLGAWSWDAATGEEFRVGAGLSEPYNVSWCAVEYFESTGTILQLLLQYHSPNALHGGRTLLHHAILCSNPRAVSILLACGADYEFPVKTSKKHDFRPIHMAVRLGNPVILQILVDNGADINAITYAGETAVMLCAQYKCADCLRVLVAAGADLGLASFAGATAGLIASSREWSSSFQQVVLDVIRSGVVPRSSDPSVFSPMMFAAYFGDVGALEVLLLQPDANIDEQDMNGFSAVMVAAQEDHVDAFRYLVFAGANVKLTNAAGETAVELSRLNENRDLFELVMLEFALERGNAGGFYALHCAARHADLAAVRLLTSEGYGVNVRDGDGYTPLMLAAKEGHGAMCSLLIACGARCDIKTLRGETALSLARLNSNSDAENVILDELARILVIEGRNVKKHTKCGKGKAHMKVLRMVEITGVLKWGNSSHRKVAIKEAIVGGSSVFQRHRKAKGDGHEPGLFRVVTAKGKEIHFVCEGGKEMSELWVRGIKLVAKAASAI